MKKLLVLFTLIFILGFSSVSSSQDFFLTLAHNLAEDHAVHIAMTEWAEAVNEASNGSITINIIPNGQLGSEADCVSQIQAGQLEMTKVSAGTLANFAGAWNCVSVPYVFRDKDHLYNVMNGEIGQDLYKLTEKDGFVGIAWLESGTRCFYTAGTAVRVPADLKGLKIRTMDSQMAIDMMNAFGGSATVMGYSDIYTGMQQGVIDGAENNITALRDHADVTKFYCYDEHTMIPDVIVISSKVWADMSDEQKKIMNDTASDMVKNYRGLWAKFEEDVKAQVGDKVTYVTDVDKPAFQKAVQGIYEGLKTSDPATYLFVERIQSAQ
jgi:tripartite ATP-independent transporter DctP family solute receptor